MAKRVISISIIVFVLAINFLLGLPRLSRFSAVDEPYWTYDRTPKFWDAIKNHRWKSTNINDKPGITTAIISGIGLLKVDPMQYKSLRGDPKTEEQLNAIRNVNFNLRLPIFIFVVLMLPLFYFFLKKIFDEKIAIIGFILIGLSPILLGISLIINPDSLLWLFLNFSLLAYFIYKKEGSRQYLILSGMFLGFSLLTKYVANILYVFFFIAPFLEYIFLESKPPLGKYLKKAFFDYLILVAVSMLFFFLFYPATWKNPNLLLKGTFLSKAFQTTWPLFAGIVGIIFIDAAAFKNRLSSLVLNWFSKYKRLLINAVLIFFLFSVGFVFLNTYSGMKFFNFEQIIASPKGTSVSPLIFIGKIFSDFYSLIFGVSPLILFGAIFFLVLIIRKRNDYPREMKIVFYFILFILFYYLASTVNSVVATVRYQIVLYPLFIIIGALGINYILETKKIIKIIPRFVSYMIILIVLIIPLFWIKPFYFTYASSLLPQKYILNLKDMGDGSYEAANYLNNLPNAGNLLIWSDKGAVCESFVGKCTVGFSKKDLAGKNFDYFAVSSGRKSRTSKLGKGIDNINFSSFYGAASAEYQLYFDGRSENFVRVIKNPNE